MNTFVHICKLSLGRSLSIFTKGFPSQKHFLLLSQKDTSVLLPQSRTNGIQCYSCSPLLHRLHESVTIAHQAFLFCDSHVVTGFLQLPFIDFQEIQVLQLQHLDWTPSLFIPCPTTTFISEPSKPIGPTFRLRQRHPGHYPELVLQDIKVWNLPLSPQHLYSTQWALILLWNLLLCAHNESWFPTPLYCPQVWESQLPLWPHHPVKDPMLNQLNFHFISPFPLFPNPRHIPQSVLSTPIPWQYTAEECCIVMCTIEKRNLCSLTSAGFSVFLNSIFVILLLYFLLHIICYLKLTFDYLPLSREKI